MAEDSTTFSESWYRIADQRISIRPGVRVRRQFFRGELWYVLEDPFNNQFFRLRPAAHAFVSRLRVARTVQEAWEECLARNPDEAPGQEEVIRLIAQLYFANLLQYDVPTDSAQLFERYRKRRERELKARWLNIMFLRIPIFDPDALLDRCAGLIRLLVSPWGALVWTMMVAWGAKVAVDHFALLRQQVEGVLAPGNLVLLYAALAIVKTLHEFGHAAACKRYGGEVHVIGIMFLIFTPVPYVDATSSWGFRSRWQRILVGASGMIVELFIAAIAMVVWAATAPGTLHSLAYNMIFVASVSTVVFNANPLLRYDGYYMLSDWLEIPNLAQRGNQQLRYFAEKYLFGLRRGRSPGRTRREVAWLSVFAVTSNIYRVIVFSGILLFVADRFLLLGLLMALACLIAWIVIPLGQLARYLVTHPLLERQRPRAIAVTLALFGLGFGLLQFLPFPNRFRAPGLAQAQEKAQVINETAGWATEVFVSPGAEVTNGQAIVQLHNPELEWEFASAHARAAQTEALWRLSVQSNAANLKPLEKRRESIQREIQRLEKEREALTVRARQAGRWAAAEPTEYRGRWLPRGTDLGLVLQPAACQFTATVAQTDVDRLFGDGIRRASVRLRGQAEIEIPVGDLRVIPAGQSVLPSAALGWLAGGEVAVAPNDPNGVRAREPFFELKADLNPPPGLALLHGRSGKIRFDLAPEPLLKQWYRRLRQLLQKRYLL